jgi:hypothetical protein
VQASRLTAAVTAGVEALKAAAYQRLAAGQGELDLGLGLERPTPRSSFSDIRAP